MLITLRITGLGHNMTLKDLPSTTMTMAELMTKIYNSAGLIPRYQRLIGPRGLKIDSNNDNDNGGGGGDEKTLFEIGIKDRTKLILMHSPLYTNEKDSYEKLIEIEKDVQLTPKEKDIILSGVVLDEKTQIREVNHSFDEI